MQADAYKSRTIDFFAVTSPIQGHLKGYFFTQKWGKMRFVASLMAKYKKVSFCDTFL